MNDTDRLVRGDVIRSRYRRPRKVRLRVYRRMRLAQALANAPEGADPHSVKRWAR